jgi:hypothetical protein
VACGAALAQESASYRLDEHVFNAGGHPADGVEPVSASYRMSLDAMGDSLVPMSLSSASYRLDGGFGSAYPPPGEVLNLVFLDDENLAWDPERSAGTYDLYRDVVGALPGLGYGACQQQDLPSAGATDTDLAPTGQSFFYLVTVSNRLGEAGTKGFDGGDGEREGTVCP